MSHLRRAYLRVFLGGLACVAILAALWACGGGMFWTQTPQPPDAAHISPLPAAGAIADHLPPPPQDFDDDRDRFVFSSDEGESGPSDVSAIEASPVPQALRQAMAAAERIDEEPARLVECGDSSPLPVARPKPTHGVASQAKDRDDESSRLVQCGDSSPLFSQQVGRQNAAARGRSSDKSLPSKALALLPDWLRHLPETVAENIGISDPEPKSSKSAPALPPDQPAEEARVSSQPAAPLPTDKFPSVPKYDAADLWHEPETLIASLRELSGNAATSKWATAVMQETRGLGPAIVADSDEATAILDHLTKLSRQTPALAAKLPDRAFARRWREIGYALDRRIDVWRQVVKVSRATSADAIAPALNAKKLSECLAKVDALIGDASGGQAWRDFLLLDALNENCAKTPLPDRQLSRETAQRALVRLTQTPLTLAQQRFVSSPAVTALRVELWHWAVEPITPANLLRDVDRYERTRLQSDARRLAIDCQSLWVSTVAAERQLADRVDWYYRNANFRFAVTAELLNDLVPEERLEYAPVNEMVVGQPVQGESLTATKLAVRMLPDPARARLALEVTGDMSAITTTDAGVARFHNESETRLVGRKPLEIDMKGISVWPVEVYVQNNTRLSGLETSVDGVPLLNWLAGKAAQSQYYMNLSTANEETRRKIVARASERIDREVRQRLSEVVDRLNQRVFDPLNSLALEPQLIEAQTDEKRFTMRLRIGGEDQLGSHTPRPQAIEDSLASFQIHESVINNGIQRLQLDGRTFSVPELSRYVASRLNCPAPFPTNPDNDDVKIIFAERNSVVIRCQDGQAVLMLSIAKLSKGKPHRSWHDFQIVANYRPVARGRSAQLMREGPIQLYGAKDTGSQFALRGIFGRALSRKTPFNLIPEKIVNQPKLQDAAITQFVINDGWIGLALGPKPLTASHRQRTEKR
jgi:hypothetical protein